MFSSELLNILNDKGYIDNEIMKKCLQKSVESKDIDIFNEIIGKCDSEFLKYVGLNYCVKFIMQNNLFDTFNIILEKNKNYYINTNILLFMYKNDRMHFLEPVYKKNIKIDIFSIYCDVQYIICECILYMCNNLDILKSGKDIKSFNSLFMHNKDINVLIQNAFESNHFRFLIYLYKNNIYYNFILQKVIKYKYIRPQTFNKDGILILFELLGKCIDYNNKHDILINPCKDTDIQNDIMSGIHEICKNMIQIKDTSIRIIIKTLFNMLNNENICEIFEYIFITSKKICEEINCCVNSEIIKILKGNCNKYAHLFYFSSNLFQLFDDYNLLYITEWGMSYLCNNKYLLKNINLIHYLNKVKKCQIKYDDVILNINFAELNDLDVVKKYINMDHYKKIDYIKEDITSQFPEDSEHNECNILYCLNNKLISDEHAIYESVYHNFINNVKYIIKKGYNVKSQNNLLLKLICKFNRANMLYILGNVSYKNSVLATISVTHNSTDVLNELIKKGCNINVNSKLYEICVKNDCIQILKILHTNKYNGNLNNLPDICMKKTHKIEIIEYLLLNNLFKEEECNDIGKLHRIYEYNIFDFIVKNNIYLSDKFVSREHNKQVSKHLIYDKRFRNNKNIQSYKKYLDPLIHNIYILNKFLIKDICVNIIDILMQF